MTKNVSAHCPEMKPKCPDIACVLFDLDGTLLDTAPDLLNALNHVLAIEGKKAMQLSAMRHQVSHGSKAVLNDAFKEQSEADAQRRRQLFLNHYAEHCYVDTRFFHGMADLLDILDKMAIPWGVVTNKPEFLTDPLMQKAGLNKRATSIISGDTLSVSKPDPLPLLTAAQQCGVAATQCLYIGDAQRDIDAANAAGMTSVLATYGYLCDHDKPETWQADYEIQQPLDVLAFLPSF